MFTDLREHWDLDLVAFLRGEVASSPRLILTMIRHLPEGSNYVAKLASAPDELANVADDDTPPPPPDPVYEFKHWTEERRLLAQLINSVHMLIRYSVPWEKGKEPKFEIVGPAAWRDGSATPKPAKQLTVFDVIQTVTGQ